MYTGLHVKYPLFLSDLKKKKKLDRFLQNTPISNFTKIFPWGPRGAMQTEGRTGGPTDRHDKANSRFSQFCEITSKRWSLGRISNKRSSHKILVEKPGQERKLRGRNKDQTS